MNPSSLETHLGYWLRFVSNHVSQAFAHRLEAEGVNVAEWVVLRELYAESPLSPSVLSSRMGMTRGGVSKLTERLLGKALIVRAPDPDDGRAHRLSLTPEARALVPRLAALADDNDAAFFAHLSAEDKATLRRILEGLARHHNLTTVPTE